MGCEEDPTPTLSFIDDVPSLAPMSNPPIFTTSVKSFDVDDDKLRPAFTSTTLAHQSGTVVVSGYESASFSGSHVTGYVHHASGVSFSTGETDDGEPTVSISIAGEVPTKFTIFGVALADVLIAAAEAMRSR
jgi:hypothetical protein